MSQELDNPALFVPRYCLLACNYFFSSEQAKNFRFTDLADC